MICSMTGYGRGEAVLNGRTITVEVRSVNNRYLDCSIKMPRAIYLLRRALNVRSRAVFLGAKWMSLSPWRECRLRELQSR